MDTVILGCTHYPLIRPILQRVFGRGVTLVFSAEETAREVAETLARKGIENDDGREGAYRFLTTGDPELFREMGRRFLQLPIETRGARRGRRARGRRMRHDGRTSGPAPRARHRRRTTSSSRTAPCSTRRGRRSCSARRRSRRACRAGSRKSGRGWMTAEYAMLPASTGERTQRAVSRGRPDGRTVEIQRLIGRALRSVCDFQALGERTLWLDCDVLQADGGTRCASITGAWIAARRALDRFGLSKALTGAIAAVSVGIVDGEAVLDLDYEEDSSAETDMNVVMTGDGRLVEVQATAERDPFSRELLDALLDLAAGGIEELTAAQARSRRGASPREAAPRLPQREQAARAAGRASRLGTSRSSTRRTSPSRTARRSSTTRASRRATADCTRRPTPGSPGRTRGSRSPRSEDVPGVESARWAEDGVARLLAELDGRERPPRALRLRAGRARSERRRAPRRGHPRRARSRTRAAATRASATTRSSCRAASR